MDQNTHFTNAGELAMILAHNMCLFIFALMAAQSWVLWVLQITLLIISIIFYLMKIKEIKVKKKEEDNTKPTN